MNLATLEEQLDAAYAAYEQLSTLNPLRAQSPLVRGSGPLNAPVMLIGEAPGAEEARRRRPFVGRSGRLLNTLLAEVGLPRRFCYITNVLAYRPPGNRTPERFEIVASRDRLYTEILTIRPVLVVTLGAVALRAMKSGGPSITDCHGQPEPVGFFNRVVRRAGDGLNWEAECQFMMLPTFHPSAALRSERVLAMMRADLRYLDWRSMMRDD